MKTNIEMKQTAYDNHNTRYVARRPRDYCAIALGLPQGDRPMSVRFYGRCKAIVWQPCVLPTTIARVYDHFWVQKRQSKIVRCPHDQHTVIVRCYCDVSTGYSNLSLCGVKQNRRGHDARTSVR